MNHMLLILLLTALVCSNGQRLSKYFSGMRFDACELDGMKSARNGNHNCSFPTRRGALEGEANETCEKRFKAGCQLAKIRELCQRGTSDLLANRTSTCKPLEIDEAHFGYEYYELCCKVCGKGIEAYTLRKSCELKTGKQDKVTDYVKQQFVHCCSSFAFPDLKSNELEPEDPDFSSPQIGFGPENEPENEDDDSRVDFFPETGCLDLECEQGCAEIQGEARCTCDDGYQLNSDGLTCDDIDECSVYNELCSESERCVNYKGTFNCEEDVNRRSVPVTTSTPNSDLEPVNTPNSDNSVQPENASLKLNFNLCMLLLVGLATVLTQMDFV